MSNTPKCEMQYTCSQVQILGHAASHFRRIVTNEDIEHTNGNGEMRCLHLGLSGQTKQKQKSI